MRIELYWARNFNQSNGGFLSHSFGVVPVPFLLWIEKSSFAFYAVTDLLRHAGYNYRLLTDLKFVEDSRRIRRALLSVSDKSGLADFAHALVAMGIEIVSTGGTASFLAEHGIETIPVEKVTGFPEIMEGRVKTLHPMVHGGLLGRRAIDAEVMEIHGIRCIELLVVNLYPFEHTVNTSNVTWKEALEQIDIGGPAMIRAAAKNNESVTVVVDPDDYGFVLSDMRAGQVNVSPAHRRQLAIKAFAHTARYDSVIADWMQHKESDTFFPERIALWFDKAADLRYGENPHQRAAAYRDADDMNGDGGVLAAEQIQGKPLSFNNLADADAARQCALEFSRPACVIVKHANPCGVATASDLSHAYLAAFACDPESAFGGIIAFNRTLDAATAKMILDRQFVEVIVAPEVESSAIRVLSAKPNIRVLTVGMKSAHEKSAWDIKRLQGGILVQTTDRTQLSEHDLQVVTQREPSPTKIRDLLFAWQVVRYVKSNAIVIARNSATLGIGAGQASRVLAVKIAGLRASEADIDLRDSVLASDAFFPFPDGVERAAELGISTIIQPGGSRRDDQVIASADRLGLSMVFTGQRHFRH